MAGQNAQMLTSPRPHEGATGGGVSVPAEGALDLRVYTAVSPSSRYTAMMSPSGQPSMLMARWASRKPRYSLLL